MKKGVVLLVIIGIMMVVFILALVALYLMTNESRIAEHKIKRGRALSAAQAAINQTLERLRKGESPDAINGTTVTIGDSAEQGYPIDVTLQIGSPIDGTDTAFDGIRPFAGCHIHARKRTVCRRIGGSGP